MIFSILYLAFRIANFIELDLVIVCHHIRFFLISSKTKLNKKHHENHQLLLLQATRGARNPNFQVVITHTVHVCSQHLIGLPVRMYVIL